MMQFKMMMMMMIISASGNPVGVAVCTGVLALPLHQDDLPPHALLLPPHQDAADP